MKVGGFHSLANTSLFRYNPRGPSRPGNKEVKIYADLYISL